MRIAIASGLLFIASVMPATFAGPTCVTAACASLDQTSGGTGDCSTPMSHSQNGHVRLSAASPVSVSAYLDDACGGSASERGNASYAFVDGGATASVPTFGTIGTGVLWMYESATDDSGHHETCTLFMAGGAFPCPVIVPPPVLL